MESSDKAAAESPQSCQVPPSPGCQLPPQHWAAALPWPWLRSMSGCYEVRCSLSNGAGIMRDMVANGEEQSPSSSSLLPVFTLHPLFMAVTDHRSCWAVTPLSAARIQVSLQSLFQRIWWPLMASLVHPCANCGAASLLQFWAPSLSLSLCNLNSSLLVADSCMFTPSPSFWCLFTQLPTLVQLGSLLQYWALPLKPELKCIGCKVCIGACLPELQPLAWLPKFQRLVHFGPSFGSALPMQNCCTWVFFFCGVICYLGDHAKAEGGGASAGVVSAFGWVMCERRVGE